MPELTLTWRIAVASLCGLAVGVEREWSGSSNDSYHRFAGIRTFLLFGLLGGVGGAMATIGYMPVAVVTILGGVALAVVALIASSLRRGNGLDATTETSAVVVLALGALAGVGQMELASGAAALMVLALVEKARLHSWVRSIDERELLAALRFAVLALVILPLVPNEPIAMLAGTRPRTLWAIVLLFTALNFAGYLAQKVAGTSRGYGITGLLGGLVSSVAVTLNFARQSRHQEEACNPLAFGVLAASTVQIPKVLAVMFVLNRDMGLRLVPILLPPILVGVAIIALAIRHSGPSATITEPDEGQSPLALWSAIQMAVGLQLVLVALQYVERWWGEGGVLASAAILGLTNTNALTLAMSRLGVDADAARLGALATGVGVLASTFFKLVLTLTLGTPAFRRVASGGLVLLILASGAGLWLGARF